MTSAFDSLDILKVWTALGGAELRGKRGRAFWRDGDGYNVAIDRERGAWFDHRDGEGGGILDLVMVARNYGKPDAVEWLKQQGFIQSVEQPHAERKQHTQLSRRASGIERELEDFALGLRVLAESEDAAREFTWLPKHEMVMRAICGCCPGYPVPEIANAYATLKRTDPRTVDLLVRLGAEDREHAERITWILVEALTIAQRKARE